MGTKLLTKTIDSMHKKFADEFLKCGVINEAARRAGYSPKSAHVSGNRLLKRPDVQCYLEQRREALSNEIADEETGVTLQQRLQSELEKMAFANIKNYIRIDEEGKPIVDLSNATEEDLAALTSVRTKRRQVYDREGKHIATEETADLSMADKYRGIELLGKTVGMFKEEGHRLIIDVADRLLTARNRLSERGYTEAEFRRVSGGGGG